MAMENFTTHASSAMTVISLVTFLGILWWTFSRRRNDDFAEAEQLPFADEFVDAVVAKNIKAAQQGEGRHV